MLLVGRPVCVFHQRFICVAFLARGLSPSLTWKADPMGLATLYIAVSDGTVALPASHSESTLCMPSRGATAVRRPLEIR